MSFNPHQWYLNGLRLVGDNNFFVDGVASTCNTPALLAAQMYDAVTGLALNVSRIHNFTIIGDNIECYIDCDIRLRWSGHNSVTAIRDTDNKVKIINGGFLYGSGYYLSIKEMVFNGVTSVNGAYTTRGTLDGVFRLVYLPECTTLVNAAFYSDGHNAITWYLPKLTLVGASNSTATQTFYYANYTYTNKHLYLNEYLETCNSGGEEADIAYFRGRGAIITYIRNFTAPNPITDLSVGTIGATTIQVNFTAPTGSTNTIDFYEAYANGVYKNQIVSGGNITGLTTGTSYEIEVIPRDIYYNGSSSNKVTQVTT